MGFPECLPTRLNPLAEGTCFSQVDILVADEAEATRVAKKYLSENDAVSAQKSGQLQPFYRCIPTGMHGPTCIFWANLTPFSLQSYNGGGQEVDSNVQCTGDK